MKALKRVVVTGIGSISALGDDWASFKSALKNKRSSVKLMPDWDNIRELNTRLAAPVEHFHPPAHWSRKKMRSMGRVAKMAVSATESAIANAQLTLDDMDPDRCGIAYGSCTGSTDAMQDFAKLISANDISDINATTYIRLMSHTAAVNIAVFFGLRGRVIATSTACTSGSQGIGYAYEAIQAGKQDIMLAGGAEELCASEAAIFDTLYATSLQHTPPICSPSPFDRSRDGLVVGEGACTFVLESLEHAQARGADIIAEVRGYATNCDGMHVTQPTGETMATVMRLALEDAALDPDSIDYVNAHGTATKLGDIAESKATYEVFKRPVPISSLKGHIGHTLGACGALEAWATIEMMRDGWLAPTLHLEDVDPECADLHYIQGDGENHPCNIVMSNNFAFGGINTSLIFKQWSN